MKKPSDDLTPDINFLFEIGSIRFMQRMWSRFLGGNFANLAEHHFRVMWIAVVLAEREGANVGKVAKMVLVHDIAESRTGDVDYLARQYVERNEDLGITDMLAGVSIEEEFLALREEYEIRESLEARVAKDADNLDIDFELAEQAATGNQLQTKLHPIREQVAENKLYTDSARAMYQQLKTVDPHGWHLHGRNRLNSGDWKPTDAKQP